jgi:hypothetical protein
MKVALWMSPLSAARTTVDGRPAGQDGASLTVDAFGAPGAAEISRASRPRCVHLS